MLTERFGEPIGDAPGDHVGVADERNESDVCCDQCGMMPTLEGDHECSMAEAEKSKKRPVCHCGGERFNKTADGTLKCKDCGREMMPDLDEATPPGGEKVVKALKKQPGVKNPWAVAWSMKNKGEI